MKDDNTMLYIIIGLGAAAAAYFFLEFKSSRCENSDRHCAHNYKHLSQSGNWFVKCIKFMNKNSFMSNFPYWKVLGAFIIGYVIYRNLTSAEQGAAAAGIEAVLL